MALGMVNIFVFFIIENYAMSIGYENLCIFNNMQGYDCFCEEGEWEGDGEGEEDGKV